MLHIKISYCIRWECLSNVLKQYDFLYSRSLLVFMGTTAVCVFSLERRGWFHLHSVPFKMVILFIISNYRNQSYFLDKQITTQKPLHVNNNYHMEPELINNDIYPSRHISHLKLVWELPITHAITQHISLIEAQCRLHCYSMLFFRSHNMFSLTFLLFRWNSPKNPLKRI